MTDLSYMSLGKRQQLDEFTYKYTYFKTFEELISPKNNYIPVLYKDDSLPNFARRDLEELVTAFETHMRKTNDRRRIYRN